MTPELWREVRRAFDRLAPLGEVERERELEALARTDPELARETRSLLAAEARDDGFLSGAADSATDRKGERVGAWELLSRLGAGGMGEVYLARRADESFDKLVAVKLVHAELLSPILRARFAAERQALAALEHPGIARLIDGGESANGQPYLVLEYVEGRSLLEFATERQLSSRARIELFLQVLAAVAHAHRHLVVHRDLKPSNILVTEAGEAKLLDFGVAKILDAEVGVAGAGGSSGGGPTRTILRALTPEYASPEQVLGRATSTATDIYSLGVVLYELLAGRRPYRVATGAPEEWTEAALRQDVVRVAELQGDLEAVVHRALDKSPGDRYSTVDAFADDLVRFLAGRPVAARPASALDRTVKFVRRHRAGVALASAALAAIVVTAIVALAQAADARRERDRAERRFAQVRELAGTFLFDVHDAIAPLPGSTAARSLLVETGVRYFDQLAAESGDDPGLLRELAGGYERLGSLQGAVVLPNLGKSQDALANQEKALAIRSRLVASQPDSAELARELARSELAMGQALTRIGRAREAPPHTGRAVAELERAAALGPESAAETRSRGEALTTHGFLNAAAGDLDTADATMRRAVEILGPLHEAHRDDVAIGSALSMALFRQAQILNERGEPAVIVRAAAILERGLAIDRELMRRSPTEPGVRRRMVTDLAMNSDLLAATGQHEKALAGYAEALAMTEADRARDPSDALARRHICVARVRSARLLLVLERPAEARAIATPAVDDLRAMLAEDPGNAFLELSLAEGSLRLGQSLQRLASRGGLPGESPAELRRRGGELITAAIDRLTPLVERGSITGSDAALLDEARRELGAT